MSPMWLACGGNACAPRPQWPGVGQLFVSVVGHCHPRVVAACAEQMSKLVQVPDAGITDTYTKHLLSTFPDNMGHVFYVHSGSG